MPFDPSASDSIPSSFESRWARSLQNSSSLEEEMVRFFVEFRDSLLRYILSQGLSVHDGEEVAQEVFLTLHQYLRRGNPRTNLKRWIFSAGHNLALKRRFQNGRSDSVFSAERTAESLHAPGQNPEDPVGLQRGRKVLAVVNSLPERERNCLHLRAEGLHYREIAEILGIPQGSVCVALTRALTRLREAEPDHED